jgi:hypothetical protein
MPRYSQVKVWLQCPRCRFPRYSVSSNGTATVGGGTVAFTNGNVIYYIDESPINSHPSVTVIEQ